MIPEFTLYTDGCVLRNPDSSGWSALLIQEEKLIGWADGHIHHNINSQRAELAAITIGVRLLLNERYLALGENYTAKVFTDCQQLIDVVQRARGTGCWPHMNADLWEKLGGMVVSGKVSLHRVKGHSRDFFNTLADHLARTAASKGITSSAGSKTTTVRRMVLP